MTEHVPRNAAPETTAPARHRPIRLVRDPRVRRLQRARAGATPVRVAVPAPERERGQPAA